jgi:hypothetical protein
MATETTDTLVRRQQAADTCQHQPGQAAFRSLLPEDIDWKPFPASARPRDPGQSPKFERRTPDGLKTTRYLEPSAELPVLSPVRLYFPLPLP